MVPWAPNYVRFTLFRVFIVFEAAEETALSWLKQARPLRSCWTGGRWLCLCRLCDWLLVLARFDTCKFGINTGFSYACCSAKVFSLARDALLETPEAVEAVNIWGWWLAL